LNETLADNGNNTANATEIVEEWEWFDADDYALPYDAYDRYYEDDDDDYYYYPESEYREVDIENNGNNTVTITEKDTIVSEPVVPVVNDEVFDETIITF